MGIATTGFIQITQCFIIPRISKMKMSVLVCSVFLTLCVLVPSISCAEKKSSKFRTDLCAKCEYCKEDPSCSGCARCSECKSRRDYGCKFCKKGEEEAKCVERCTKGCRICENLESCNKS